MFKVRRHTPHCHTARQAFRWFFASWLLLLFWLAPPGMAPGSAQVAAAASLDPAARFLYVSATAVRSYDTTTGVSSTVATVSDGTPGWPSRALSGQGWTYSVRSSTGPLRTYLVERVTHPTQDTTHLLATDAVFAPRVSPDGSKLLYITEELVPEEGVVNNLYVWSAAPGSTTLELDNVDGADWSPDGTRLAYLSYSRARFDPQGVMLYLYNPATGTSSKVPTAHIVKPGEVNIYSPRWSPSGQWIAFQRYDFHANTVSIVRTDPAGTSETVMLTAPLDSVGQGMEWVSLPGGGERLYVESVVPGGAPYVLVDAGGVGGASGTPVLHAAFSWQALPEFSDLGPGSTFLTEIRDLATVQVVGGFADGSFRPGAPVKRAQYAKMITVALGLHDGAWTNWSSPTFADVPRPAIQDDFFRYPFDYVEEGAAAALIKGDTTGLFQPWAEITRVQLALMVARAGQGKLEPPGPADYLAFTDTAGLSAEARAAIAFAHHHGIIKGKTVATFAPYAPATRGQVAAMTWRLMKKLELLG